MTDIQKGLQTLIDKLDIISMVTGIEEQRLREIANGAEMTEAERITLEINA